MHSIIEFFIVCSSIASLCPGVGNLLIVRLLRVLRPLRLLSRVPGMQVIFTFLVESAGDIFNVVGVVVFCHAFFAVIGMEVCACSGDFTLPVPRH